MMNEPGGIIFFGTSARFSVTVFERLIELNVVPGALVVPEYPASENLPLLCNIEPDIAQGNPLIKLARQMNIPLHFAPRKNHMSLAGELSDYAAEFVLVACWPYLLSERVYASVSKAALNLHPSLLPNYRGANPVEEQVRRGETQLGVSLHLLNQTFDSGDIVSQSRIDMPNKKITVKEIEKKTARVGADIFVEAMNIYGTTLWQPYKQLGA